jgi:hypothetical protein
LEQGLELKGVETGCRGARLGIEVFNLDAIADGGDTPACLGSRGNTAGHRGPIELGEQRLLTSEAIDFLGIGLRAQSAFPFHS